MIENPTPPPEPYEHLEAEYTDRLRRLAANHPEGLVLTVPWYGVASVIGNLQLALRHPLNHGPSRNFCRSFVDQIIDGIAQEDPRFAELLRLGDDPRYDVHRSQS